ncbi:polycystic kidney disease 2-like 1 protein [Teleopsis dalmanni]|nr:polycystic kidney disease 2-like 1 protein [Teleopsis dalmanni]
MSIMMGTFDYTNLEYGSPTLGPIFFISYIALVYFILMNMFLAIIFDTYNTIKNDIKSGPRELNTYLSNAMKKLRQRMLTNRKRQQEVTTVLNESTEVVAEPKPTSVDQNTTHQPTNEPSNMTESFVVREYFENYIRDEERRKIINLANRIDLLEDVIKKLSVDVEELLKKVKSKQRSRS